ncbi:MAG: N-acetyltransferase [Proteobacteria bacterium]|nr:MAG: N-acetyltransferase [Pseudomonadota bacterium]
MTSRTQPDKPPRFAARTIRRTCDVPRDDWNALLDGDDTPFVRHEFLELLEDTLCVGPGTGWTPCHIVASRGGDAVDGVSPLYLKEHSYGEYVFDWAWANAYQQHGIDYYPKLVCAVPFTPVTSRKLLTAGRDRVVAHTLIAAIDAFARGNPLSSIHALFLTPKDAARFEGAGYLVRHDNQFHWRNNDYADFDDYLARFTSKKRKNIRAERRQVAAAGVRYRWLHGPETSEADWLAMYDLYVRTISEHGGFPYLKRDFFLGLASAMADRVLLLQGRVEADVVCGALYFLGERALYGRYWGANRFIPHLHFETCYYQPIEYAISRGLVSFEAGAQGLHKLSRGLEPTTTRSAHWLKHPAFYDAVDRFLTAERGEQERYTRLLRESLPFRQSDPDPQDK